MHFKTEVSSRGKNLIVTIIFAALGTLERVASRSRVLGVARKTKEFIITH
jgi:hypothetical protein